MKDKLIKYPYLTALLGGMTISLFPAWFVTIASRLFPSLAPEELEVVSRFFAGGIGTLQIIFFLLIVFMIPIIEEGIFRGFLWDFLKLKLSSKWTWILVSLIFAVAHWELLHILGLLPFSFFVGWLKKETDKLLPSIVAHMANNAVGCALMMFA